MKVHELVTHRMSRELAKPLTDGEILAASDEKDLAGIDNCCPYPHGYSKTITDFFAVKKNGQSRICLNPPNGKLEEENKTKKRIRDGKRGGGWGGKGGKKRKGKMNGEKRMGRTNGQSGTPTVTSGADGKQLTSEMDRKVKPRHQGEIGNECASLNLRMDLKFPNFPILQFATLEYA